MRGKITRGLMVMAALMLGLGWYCFGNPAITLAGQTSATTVSVNPASATLSGCETIAVEIWVNDVIGLYGADVKITFDPAVLEVQDDDPIRTGVQVQVGDFLSPDFVLFNTADNLNGTIRYTSTQLNPTPPASGSGKLIIIHFRAKTSGSSSIHFNLIELANREGGGISATGVDGLVTANAPASPILTIAKLNASDARLSWTSVGGAADYRLYRGTAPYFTPADPAYQTLSSTQYDDVGVLGNPATNYFYTVKAVCPNGMLSENSNRVGEFDFALIRNTSNTIALPLIDPALQTADQLGLATGSSKVSEWVAESSLFRTRMVGITGVNFALQTGRGYFIRTNANPTPTVFTTVGGVPEAGSVTFSIYRETTCKLNLLSVPLDHPELNTALKLANSIGGVPKISEWIASSSGGYFRTYLVGIGPVNFTTMPGYPYWPCANTSGGGAVWP
ncbi:MAG: cohesin domain-containing protein [Chloroflexota bacterium]